jgi:uncharacterized membrane protein
MSREDNTIKKIWNFYLDGFKSMTYGKTLWLIILLKLFILFVILKLFFFRDDLNRHANTDQQKSEYVLDQLIKNY